MCVCSEEKKGLVRESNPGPLAPKARIMPLDQQASTVEYFLYLPPSFSLSLSLPLCVYRYAHQTRNIINVARVNEDPNAKLIRGYPTLTFTLTPSHPHTHCRSARGDLQSATDDRRTSPPNHHSHHQQRHSHHHHHSHHQQHHRQWQWQWQWQ